MKDFIMTFRSGIIACFSISIFGLFASSAFASPAADFVCDVKPHPLLQVDGVLLGERIYFLGDDRVGLVGYSEANEQLPRVVSGSGMQFSNGVITFGAKGDEGFLSLNDDIVFPCRSVKKQEIAPATALGTVIRNGPSVKSAKIETLPMGEPLSLTRETGAFLNGFQWYEVSYSEGATGFAWGGTMCVDTELSGILIDCRRYVTQANPQVTNKTPPSVVVMGRSLFGSKIRERDDPNARQVDSIAQGEPVEIIGETGSFFDGWQWIRVRYSEGLEGYVWGGTICITQGRKLTGVHETCN